MKRTIILISFIFAVFTIQAQSLFSPIPSQIRANIQAKQVQGKYKASLSGTDSTSFVTSFTMGTSGIAYKFGANQGAQLLSAAGAGLSYAKYTLLNGKATPIWDVSAMFMTSINLQNQTATGLGGMVAIGFNPSYLAGIGPNIIIREGLAVIGTSGFNNASVYAVTSLNFNF